MPQIDVIGFKRYSFQNDNGSHVSGTSLFYLSPIDSRSGVGNEVKKISVKSEVMNSNDFVKLGKYQVEQWDGKICSCKYLGN